MIRRCFAKAANRRSGMDAGSFDSQYLRGSASPRGHWISSHSSVRGWCSL
jgi:hypothetical protein